MCGVCGLPDRETPSHPQEEKPDDRRIAKKSRDVAGADLEIFEGEGGAVKKRYCMRGACKLLGHAHRKLINTVRT